MEDRIDYFSRIRQAKTRFEAADLIRAHSCKVAATLCGYTDAQRVAIIEQGENNARQLEHNFSEEDQICESNHPWKRWLQEWGYGEF